jgi:hypothetical protein
VIVGHADDLGRLARLFSGLFARHVASHFVVGVLAAALEGVHGGGIFHDPRSTLVGLASVVFGAVAVSMAIFTKGAAGTVWVFLVILAATLAMFLITPNCFAGQTRLAKYESVPPAGWRQAPRGAKMDQSGDGAARSRSVSTRRA